MANRILRIVTVSDKNFIHSIFQSPLGNSETAGRIPLGINIENQYLFPFYRKTGRQINICRGLADSAFLIKNCYCFTQYFAPFILNYHFPYNIISISSSTKTKNLFSKLRKRFLLSLKCTEKDIHRYYAEPPANFNQTAPLKFRAALKIKIISHHTPPSHIKGAQLKKQYRQARRCAAK